MDGFLMCAPLRHKQIDALQCLDLRGFKIELTAFGCEIERRTAIDTLSSA